MKDVSRATIKVKITDVPSGILGYKINYNITNKVWSKYRPRNLRRKICILYKIRTATQIKLRSNSFIPVADYLTPVPLVLLDTEPISKEMKILKKFGIFERAF